MGKNLILDILYKVFDFKGLPVISNFVRIISQPSEKSREPFFKLF